MSETERRLFGLMEVAERHQAAAQEAVEALRVERAALAAERARLNSEREAWRAEMRWAAEGEMRRGLQAVADKGTQTVAEAARPLLAELRELPQRATETRAALEASLSWMGGRLLAWGVGTVFVVLAIGCVASLLVSWWDADAIGQLQFRKEQLEEEVARLDANAADWKQAGMQSRIARCDDRPCVQVDENSGPYVINGRGYRILREYGY